MFAIIQENDLHYILIIQEFFPHNSIDKGH